MCGIAGIISQQDYLENLRAMVKSIHHRGPDDFGSDVFTDGSSKIYLGSTRLAIVDLSELGHMPMIERETGIVIIFNGEVYNFRTLRAELISLGEQFVSGTDTEVVLKAYKRWGKSCINRFEGMFAFAILDPLKKIIFLARDRVGKKPLYFSRLSDGGFIFASEVRALLASRLIARKLSIEALNSFLSVGYVISPFSIIDGVESLMPGYYLEFDLGNGNLSKSRYWQFPKKDSLLVPNDLKSHEDEIRHRFSEAVEKRLVSDVPLGAFLSGGLDSSAIVAQMSRLGTKARTFSIGFKEKDFDESNYAQWVADRFNTDHTEIILEEDGFSKWLNDALLAMDQPTFDGINTYFVSRAAKESGLTVALSGLGGDELFGGYPFFKNAQRILSLNALSSKLGPSRFKNRMYDFLRSHTFSFTGPWKVIEAISRKERLSVLEAYQLTQSLFLNHNIYDHLLSQRVRTRERTLKYGLPVEFTEFTDAGNLDFLELMSRYTFHLFHGERTLRDTDMMSMGNSLEVRAPFDDHKFIESVVQIPSAIRCKGAPHKPFQWKLFKTLLGDDYPYRQKQGFVFPFHQWLQKPVFLREIRLKLRDEDLTESVGLNSEYLQTIINAYKDTNTNIPWSRIWSLYVLLYWCGKHGVTYDG